MSGSKIYFLCAVAGLAVALVAAQNLDCVQESQAILQSYQQDTLTQVSQFGQQIQAHGGSMADVEKFQKQIEQSMQSFMKLLDVSNGVSFSKFRNAYSQLIQSYIDAYGTFSNMEGVSGMSSSWFSFAQSMNTATTKMMAKIIASCLAGSSRVFQES